MKGVGGVINSLNELPKAAQRGIEREIAVSLVELHSYAVNKIQGGARTGRTYRRGGKMHQASAPGEFPKTDHGQLVASLFFRMRTLGGFFGSMLNYAKYLEFGTSRMSPRPWLRPTFQAFKDTITRRINTAVANAVKEASRG